MNMRAAAAILLTGILVNASEFFRNELLLKDRWLGHYDTLGLTFPSTPLNGMVWALWGLLFAIAIYFLTRRHSLLQTTLLAWLLGFVLMWIVIGNLGVLPVAILPYAIPLSLFEAFAGALICLRLAPPANKA